ncbi:hypothetical protein [Acutalibacter muris]|uniref:hypothetical protein n=1 Tax=Acutalibacter muris TaxID=1796620 RepID=UPI001C3EB813|nr:hypothetical protein [Acutalibacter muris]
MIYISKGTSKSSLRHPLKVTRCGKTIQISGLQAELWRKGRYGFASAQTKAEEMALKSLSRAGLAEIQQESSAAFRYYALTSCVLCPTRRPGIGLSAGEKELLCWLKKAGLRMTVAELVYLRSRNIHPTRKLLRARNRRALVEKIYNPRNIADNLLEQQMESESCRDEVVADLLSLLRKKRLVLL